MSRKAVVFIIALAGMVSVCSCGIDEEITVRPGDDVIGLMTSASEEDVIVSSSETEASQTVTEVSVSETEPETMPVTVTETESTKAEEKGSSENKNENSGGNSSSENKPSDNSSGGSSAGSMIQETVIPADRAVILPKRKNRRKRNHLHQSLNLHRNRKENMNLLRW